MPIAAPSSRSAPPLEEPIRSELFGIERLEQHAESLAAAQRVTSRPERRRPLLARVEDNGRVLREAYRVIARAIREERVITPAAEWLADNFHLVDEQLREIGDDLPAGFYRELPKLAEGPLAGYPRVYGIAWAFVAHTDSRFDPEALRRFVRAYQRVQPLTIGELWAVAITLRVVLVENLRRLVERIVRGRAARQEADALADELLGLGGPPVGPRATALDRLDGTPLVTAFAVQLVQRLRGQDPAVTPALRWLDERLAAQGTSADDMVRVEHQRQAAMNVTVRNVILSMGLLSALDWGAFFESVSLVDEVLQAGTDCGALDFATRDRYRHAIEELARGSDRSELDVARATVQHVTAGRDDGGTADHPRDERCQDPGYYLIGNGRAALEQTLGFRAPVGRRLLRWYVAAATPGYIGTIVVLTSVLLAIPVLAVATSGRPGLAGALLLALLAAPPASDLAIALLNRGVAALLPPRVLPRLELRDGISRDLRTLVVVPTLLADRAEVDEVVERMEVHYLANPEGDCRFAVVSDWRDAPTETAPGDEETLAAAREAIARLNRRHGPAVGGGDRFLLLHRRRCWNESERCWMGWERKRGKLHELNRLLRGATDTTFLPTGDVPATAPPDVRYVITLDADTRLPRGAVIRLVGTMAHRLNRPRLDADLRRVVEGYAVLQPRVTPPLPGREGSLFQRLSSGPSGIDPYAGAVSDVYQDLFGEGSYTGKGIYDVDAFEAALANRVPENALLSHDLFEGTFARAGLVTDVEVFESAPAHYGVAAARQHRWARGDWQLLPWILGRASSGSTQPGGAGLPAIGRWKMLDNLRRTLSAPTTFLALVAGWMLPPPAPAVWTAFVFATIALPAFLPAVSGLIPRGRGISKRSHVRAVGRDLGLAWSQTGFVLTMLAHQAWLMTDAIVRTLFRVYVTRRMLLEWVSAAQVHSGLRLDIRGFYRRMGGAVVLAGAAGVAIAWWRSEAWPIALPFLLLWVASPALARWISLPAPIAGPTQPSVEDARALRLVARRTWQFFVTFVGPDDHFLPPDNFQEDPSPVVAHRTSPTNLGLYLLSTVGAHDFGWLGTVDTVSRLEATIETMGGLERFRGHFYNWYDTRECRPLDPKYVSSVDSGNLAGHLVTLAHACRQMMDQPVMHGTALAGIADAALLVRESMRPRPGGPRVRAAARRRLAEALDALGVVVDKRPRTPGEWVQRLADLEVRASSVMTAARALGEGNRDAARPDVEVWAEAIGAGIATHARDLDALMPWARLLLGEGGPGLVARSRALELLAGRVPTLAETPDRCEAALHELGTLRPGASTGADGDPDGLRGIDALVGALERSAAASGALIRRLGRLAGDAETTATGMDFGFLFDPVRRLLSLGYRATEGRLDSGHYDLLASEAQLASFFAIAKGDVPVSHWFRLGRAMTPVELDSVLLSWSGSMFEYLMPALVMRAPVGSLLEQTGRLAVRRQITYGGERGVPWGVSEAGYNVRDLEMTYQYSNFGVPGLGLRRGLADDLVIAPYATALAAMVDPAAATRNFRRLADAGACGAYGFYEALDYTVSRLPTDATVAIVRSYMAHHQGMTIVSIANALHVGAMRERFHTDPLVRATELLLQERTPRDVPVARPRVDEVAAVANVREFVPHVVRRFTSPHAASPRTHLLSNGRYAVMVTAAGSGYSRWQDVAITRWQEDGTRDVGGTYVFLREVASGDSWSAGYQPRGEEADGYEVAFSEGRVDITRRDGAIGTALEIIVSSEDDAEIRRVSVTNLGSRTRDIEVTSYAEIVLAPPAADAAHPAFSKLFVHTEIVPELDALLATRRPRSSDERQIWLAHVVGVEGETVGDLQWETDRARFLGRGREIRTPVAEIDARALSGTVGAVLDPVVSLRRRVRVRPGRTARIAFSTLVAPSREQAVDLADKYRDPVTFERAVTLAWTQAQVQLHHLGIDTAEAQLFQSLAGPILHSDPALRAPVDVLARHAGGAPVLWVHGISGDLPIVVVQIWESDDIDIVRQLLRAHGYWRMKQLAVDLVILNERAPSYLQDLQTALETLVRASQSATRHESHEPRGSVFILRADRVTLAQRDVLLAAARAVLSSRRGTLAEQVMRTQRSEPPAAAPARRAGARRPAAGSVAREHLELFNGLGGFAAQGAEYVTVLGDGQWTPAPWINVIANPVFGFQVSEAGAGYTWSVNSRERQLTPWSNDPVSDPPGEVVYVRDEDTGEVWGPTALPIRDDGGAYVARHGPGYSRFERVSHGISLDLLQFVPVADAIKISRLTLENVSGRSRRLSVTVYVEWVLGPSRSAAKPFVVTEIDADTGALLARNAWDPATEPRIAFLDLRGAQTACTGDRTEFLGRHGTVGRPAALGRSRQLSGRVGAGLDPCGALQAIVELRAGAHAEVVFLLGDGTTREEARGLLARYRTADVDAALRAVREHWDGVLGTVQVRTPDRAMDLMLNHWLLYQTLSCRLWARSAFYQAGGAYGFRDQLQDVMALTVSRPDLAREHLLRAAARQFVEGDVQHWWHVPSGRGVRTRISDDLLWLPYVLGRYVEVTGDAGILEETVPFLEGPRLAAGEPESYFEPHASEEHGSMFEHGARALDRSLAVGSHGLPLMGTGDWNDGMNRVGVEGRGESVWLAWFLHAILVEWAALARARGEGACAERWRAHATVLEAALGQDAWDGGWYRRAFFDDGTPLGSALDTECRIDSIAQSWSVLSGAADAGRARRAMAAVAAHLVRRDDRLVLLLTPPFDRTLRDPGYIKGYLPGIRENGGQYTHAAVWAIVAFARLGDGAMAAELFGMLNPLAHAGTPAGVQRYKVEPYVVAADVYSEPPHVGRGGWTWYTGSAAWLYRAGLESILGFRLRGARLEIDPCIPPAWPGFTLTFRHRSARYEIVVSNPRGATGGVASVELDGMPLDGPSLPLADDGTTHRVCVVLEGRDDPPPSSAAARRGSPSIPGAP